MSIEDEIAEQEAHLRRLALADGYRLGEPPDADQLRVLAVIDE